MSTTTLKNDYKERIVPALVKQFNYTSVMQVPTLKKIVINQGLGEATQDKKIIETAIRELTDITGQKAVATLSRKDISNFKLRKKMPVGVMVTLRRDKMYEFLERLIRVALPRIRDFKGIEGKLDGRGNYTLGITEQIIFPEINIDNISKLLGMNITFVTSANTDEEGYALLKEFGLPFKNAKKVTPSLLRRNGKRINESPRGEESEARGQVCRQARCPEGSRRLRGSAASAQKCLEGAHAQPLQHHRPS